MRMVNGLRLAALAAVGLALTGGPAMAGGPLGIADAGSALAEDIALLGQVAVVIAVAIVGFALITGMFLIMTLGIAAAIGGALAANAETVAGSWFGGGAGGGDISGYVAMAQGASGSYEIVALMLLVALTFSMAAYQWMPARKEVA